MSKSKQKNQPRREPSKPSAAPRPVADRQPLWWALGICAFTAAVFFPMLSNGLTNWDDLFYIEENMLLRGPDWAGIFTKPVVSNYHPLTVASLALNYQISGPSPFSYHFVNWLLHILNTGLVFFFIFRLTERQLWPSAFVALIFGIHPMHVESVAWASERKDVLYTFFFLLSLIFYLRFFEKKGTGNYLAALSMFAFSLLSKPAAVTLPVVLVLVDWFRGRSLKDQKLWLEKIPFFVLALIFGYVALQIQAEKAIAKETYYTEIQRLAFGFYGFGTYLIRFFLPQPLSCIHPFPAMGEVPASYFPAFAVTLAVLVAAWIFRKKNYVLFGLAFYAVNLALVLQFLTFGNSVVSERYTYVPYIGLAFVLAMGLNELKDKVLAKKMQLGLFVAAAVAFGFLTFRQVGVWKDSLTLWNQALGHYPNSHIARSNRGNFYLTKVKNLERSLEDYDAALAVQPTYQPALENRSIIFMQKSDPTKAFADATALVENHPQFARGYLLRGYAANMAGLTEQALADFSKCIELDPKNEEAWSNRAVLFFNKKQDYQAAKKDFDVSIQLNPKKAESYVNRARCWAIFGNRDEAVKDIQTARARGLDAPADLKKSLQLAN